MRNATQKMSTSNHIAHCLLTLSELKQHFSDSERVELKKFILSESQALFGIVEAYRISNDVDDFVESCKQLLNAGNLFQPPPAPQQQQQQPTSFKKVSTWLSYLLTKFIYLLTSTNLILNKKRSIIKSRVCNEKAIKKTSMSIITLFVIHIFITVTVTVNITIR